MIFVQVDSQLRVLGIKGLRSLHLELSSTSFADCNFFVLSPLSGPRMDYWPSPILIIDLFWLSYLVILGNTW